MSQLGHYVNRRHVQAAVSQVWPIFFGGRPPGYNQSKTAVDHYAVSKIIKGCSDLLLFAGIGDPSGLGAIF